MNITTNTGIRKLSACKDLFPRLKNIGYTGVDLSFLGCSNRDFILSSGYADYVEEQCRILTDAGLAVTQTHLSYWPGHLPLPGTGTYEEFEEYMLPILIKEIELTASLGCHLCVIHLYFEQKKDNSRKRNISLISALLPHLSSHQVTLAIENIYGPDYSDAHLTTAEDLLYYPEYFNSPDIGVCLDTGHAVILGQNPVQLAEAVKDRLVTIHAHTTLPGIDLHSIPYFTSYGELIDWKAFRSALDRIGYRGTFNMELFAPALLSAENLGDFYSVAYGVAKDILAG